jgi:hypothetical protein
MEILYKRIEERKLMKERLSPILMNPENPNIIFIDR